MIRGLCDRLRKKEVYQKGGEKTAPAPQYRQPGKAKGKGASPDQDKLPEEGGVNHL